MYRYKNVSGAEQLLIGHGTVPADGEITTEAPVENPNFQYVGKVEGDAGKITGTTAQQPNAVTEAERVPETKETN